MNVAKLIFSEVIGLFIDDEFLAIAILAVVGLAALLAFWLHAPALVVGGVLLLGCIGVLVSSVVRGMNG